ncbi:M23 family metallopeptidase [Fibrisoma limi]|uniref:M23 family metallopeptidase n=1 Tax=Fibrisoma limi TaxID=663275 RepID=UPI0006859A48|nr:M23 family metallopeptidase [Fibrisoma limi]
MRISTQILLFIPLLIGSNAGFSQGVFTSPAQLSTYSQPVSADTSAHSGGHSFPITYLDQTNSLASLSRPVSVSLAAKPENDSLHFLRYVDSLAIGRVSSSSRTETSQKGVTDRDRALYRLRDVPSILPFYVPASKVTGLARTRMSSGFGMRQHPVLGSLVSHAGIDLPAPLGTYVYATADGFCRQVINQPDGIGLAIYLTHGRGHQTLYGHLLSSSVKPGDFVQRGQVIGRVGVSGMTTGPHLHYGVRYNGQVVDPLPYCFLLSKTAKQTTTLTRK